MRRPVVAFVAALLSTAAVAHAHEDAPFEDVAEVAGKRPSGRVLFFPLDDDFDAASPYALLPARGRRVAWTPEATELPSATFEVPPTRAIGVPPAQRDDARYLVPVLDGAGAGLSFVARRFSGGRLVPYEGAPKPGLDVVPWLTGPRLDATPSETPLARVLGEPERVDADVLADVVPALLVRKAPPNRVVFGVRLGSDAYVPLVDEAGLAATARRDGRRGLAVSVPDGVEVGTSPSGEAPEEDETTPWPTIAAVVAGASAVVGGLGVVAWRRGSRRQLGGKVA